jgi:hypothetical protein
MSGGGGSGGGGRFGGGPRDDEVDCDNLRFEATLTSPDPLVVATVSVDDVLSVGLADPPNRRVVVIAPAGTVGSLVDHLAHLLRCLQRRAFQATVLSIDGVVVRVRVEPA